MELILKISKKMHCVLRVVLQETNLFSGSVMDNIRYGNLQATDEQCIEAPNYYVDNFISRLPQGYKTMLTANGPLYQGQMQLLTSPEQE